MKLEDVVIYAKLTCVFIGTSLLTLQTGLSQWSSEKDFKPSLIQWAMVLGGSLGTGLTATGAFLSNAFGNYIKDRSGNSNGNGNGNNNGTGSINLMTPPPPKA